MWYVVSHRFKADLLSLLELQTFRLKENNLTNTQILKTLFYFIWSALTRLHLSAKYSFDVSAIDSINTRQDFDLHPPKTNLTKAQKGLYYPGIKIFNNLPLNIRQLSHDANKFKLDLKKFLLAGYFTAVKNTLNEN
jgi:hypothetical protein